MVPMTKLLNVHFAGAELMTGLPEYRNGGLLVDTGLLTLKEQETKRGLETYHKVTPANKATEVVPTFEPSDDVVVEWRAVTVGFLDELLAAVNKGLGVQLSLAQMLEAGTWKVRFFIPSVINLTNSTGRTRNCPSIAPDHERPSNRHHQRRHCLLDHFMTRSESGSGLHSILLYYTYRLVSDWEPYTCCDGRVVVQYSHPTKTMTDLDAYQTDRCACEAQTFFPLPSCPTALLFL